MMNAAKQPHSHSAQFVPRDQEPQPPALTRVKPHVLAAGMVCEHIHKPDEHWTILSVYGYWCRASRGHGKEITAQMFPCDVLVPRIEIQKTRAGPRVSIQTTAKKLITADTTAPKAPRASRPTTADDDIADLLNSARDLDHLWMIAINNGLPKDLRAKLSHLNPGLQRMNIGNRLRNLRKGK